MSDINKGKAKIIFAWSCLLTFTLLTYHFDGFAGMRFKGSSGARILVDTPPPIKTDSPPPRKIPRVPSIKEIKTDTAKKPTTAVIDTFNFKASKDSLSSPVIYHADDSLVVDVPGEKMYLYGKISSVKYESNNLSAPQIQFDQKTSLVSAFLVKDSTGKVVSYPYYNQGDLQTVSDTIIFNIKNGRGLTKGTYTKQGEMFVYGETIKKADTNTFYAFRTRFTTCNLDTPHFAFISKRAKFVSQKWAYTGPVHPEFEGVPLPIALPFGIFPLTQGRHSGLLAPQFTVDNQRGIGLQDVGYYKIFSPVWDLVTRGTIYSYGSYLLTANPRYYRRYHYLGNINLGYQKTRLLDQPGDRTINIQWSHNADSKSRPGVTFSANVNAGSTKYNDLLPNNAILNYTNQLNSTIAYSKVWKNKPYNISINANHNQNSVTRLINLNVPDVAFNVNTLYPFRRAEPTGDYKWFENLGIAYNGTTKSLSSFYDTAGHIGTQIFDNFQYGAQHNVPLTLSLPPLGVFQLAPSVTYQEKWYQQKLTRGYDPIQNKLDTLERRKGFYTARQMSFSLSATTRIFGLFGFGEKSRIKAIRHEIRPTISANYSPNFNAHNYYNAVVDAAGNTAPVSYYEGSIYGAFTNQRFGGLSFNIDNNISMKVRNKKDTAASADKKINILDGLSVSGAYNFLLDSFQFSQITLSARSTLFDKINITGGAQFDPYQTNELGIRESKLVWSRRPVSLGNLTSANIALQSSFKSGGLSKATSAVPLDPNILTQGVTLDEYQADAAYIQNHPSEFADFSIPWSIDFSYSLLLSRNFVVTRGRFVTTSFQSVNFNASANLTEKWKIGATGSYNITTGEISYLSGYLSRDLHCWQMGINVSPVGRTRYFSINISPKSPILRDLKVNRTRQFTDF